MKRFWNKLRKVPSPLPIIFILITTVALILYGRGYRPNIKEGLIKPTGVISVTSDPVGAQVYIDGELSTATDDSINIDPGWYTVKIVQEGYIPWQKILRVQGEVVTRTDAFLFPTSPSLSPLTNTGILTPLLSPDGTKIAYVIPIQSNGITSQKAGLWVYELVERPLGLNRDPRQLGLSTNIFDFSQSTLRWSPDSTQLMVDSGKSVRLYNTARTGDFQDISARFAFVIQQWDEEKLLKDRQILASFKQEFIDVATESAKIISISPDETKILYEATASALLPLILNPPLIGTNPTAENRQLERGKLYVYDSREDKNFFVLDKNELPQLITSSPSPLSRTTAPTNDDVETLIRKADFPLLQWFPTSRHLMLTLPGKIDIMEYDRTNWVTVYSGPFVDGFIAPWPNGSRIIVMTNLNPGQSELPNLYTVNLR